MPSGQPHVSVGLGAARHVCTGHQLTFGDRTRPLRPSREVVQVARQARRVGARLPEFQTPFAPCSAGNPPTVARVAPRVMGSGDCRHGPRSVCAARADASLRSRSRATNGAGVQRSIWISGLGCGVGRRGRGALGAARSFFAAAYASCRVRVYEKKEIAKCNGGRRRPCWVRGGAFTVWRRTREGSSKFAPRRSRTARTADPGSRRGPWSVRALGASLGLGA